MTDKLYEKLDKFEGAILSTGKSIRKGKVWNFCGKAPLTQVESFFNRGEPYLSRVYSLASKIRSSDNGRAQIF